jgi:hypothetical protein
MKLKHISLSRKQLLGYTTMSLVHSRGISEENAKIMAEGDLSDWIAKGLVNVEGDRVFGKIIDQINFHLTKLDKQEIVE